MSGSQIFFPRRLLSKTGLLKSYTSLLTSLTSRFLVLNRSGCVFQNTIFRVSTCMLIDTKTYFVASLTLANIMVYLTKGKRGHLISLHLQQLFSLRYYYTLLRYDV